MGNDSDYRSAPWHFMVEAMGGDVMATRAVNQLHREGLVSLRELARLQETLGADDFRARLMDMRNFGVGALERVEATLVRYRAGEIDEPVSDQWGRLPPGLRRRLDATIDAHRREPDDSPLAGPGAAGLNAGDARALQDLLYG